jgi:excisionase family DNA binding protein
MFDSGQIGQPKQFLSPDTFSRLTGLGVHSVRNLARKGEIRCIKVGKHFKILASEVQDFPIRASQNLETR